DQQGYRIRDRSERRSRLGPGRLFSVLRWLGRSLLLFRSWLLGLLGGGCRILSRGLQGRRIGWRLYRDRLLCRVAGAHSQHGTLAVEFALINDALQIDSPQDLSGVRGNAHDLVCLPDIGIDFTSYPFELVEAFDRPSGLIRHSQAANGVERLGIEEAQVRGAI